MDYLAQMKQTIECILIKNYDDQYKDIYSYFMQYFSKESQDTLALYLKLCDENSYDELFFYNKISEITSKQYFDNFINAENIANIKIFFAEYEKYLQLSLQKQLGDYIFQCTQQNKILHLKDIIDDFIYVNKINTFTTFSQAKEQKNIIEKKYPTYLNFLDSAFNGGIATGQLILVSGNYESGKTTLCTQILENITDYAKVCFFCFEFTLQSYIQRREKSPNIFFKTDNMITITDGYDIQEIKSNIILLHSTQNVEVFLIDSQMRIENNSCKGNGEEKESEKFEILGKLAHSKGIIIILIVQTSKNDPDSPFKSKKGGHEANCIIDLQKQDDNKNVPQEVCEQKLQKRILTFKKNKQTGKHFKEEIFLDKDTGYFINVEKKQNKNDNFLFEIQLKDIPDF